LGIIDWEFTQTALWQVNHYPMPFPLVGPDENIKPHPPRSQAMKMSRSSISLESYIATSYVWLK
jgi:hypothetical protein